MDKSAFDKTSRKLVHPKQRANHVSNLFFCWAFPLLVKGFRSGFQETDLFSPLHQHESSTLGDKLEQAWALELSSKKRPSLRRPLVKLFGGEFLLIGVIVFINEFIVRLSQPVSIWKLITIQGSHRNDCDKTEAYIYAFLIVLSSFANVILYNWCIFSLRELSMKIRIACSSLIYRKSLKLSKNSTNQVAAGQIVNLLSNDLNRFDTLFLQLHYLWAAPLESIVVLYLIYTMLDVSGMVGIGIFFIFIPIQILMGKKYSNFRLKTATKTDERVRLINEILSGIQVIKMYTWEKLFISSTSNIRKQEIRYIRGTSYLKAFQNALNTFLSKGAVFACILLYVLTGNHLQSQYVFVIKSFYSLLKQSMTSDFPEAIKNIAETSVSLGRIESFLLCDEIKPQKQEIKSRKGIYLEKASAKWSSSVCETLSEINFEGTCGELVTIVGAVGSGKSSLINVLLQELPLSEGKLSVNGKISYASQEAWLFAGTVRENILFGLPLDIERYNEVVKVCALKRDFEELPCGDNSVVGDRGITLSGGQKARINLARAVYRKADIYLFDDPLSAVDASVAKQLFDQCLVGYLKHKCVILVTHQIQFLVKSDRIYLLKSGEIVTQGDYEHIRNCGDEFAKLLQTEIEGEDSLRASDSDQMSNEEKDERFKESKNFGTIPLTVYRKYLLSGGWLPFTGIILMFVLSQSIQSGSDYFESYWVYVEEHANETLAPMANFSSTTCIYIYSNLMLLILIFSIASSMSFFTYFMSVSVKLHQLMFSGIIKAPLQFFYTNPAGSILNRFSKDMGSADTTVPKVLIDTIQNGISGLAVLLLVAIVNPWMLIGSVVLLTLFYCIRVIYLATSRELKRLEAISRSPVYSHLNESLHGLETIRAFETEPKQRSAFDCLLNANTSAFYMIIALSTTFALWLSLLCSTYLTLVIVSCFWSQKTDASDLGLVITQATSLSQIFEWGMVQWTSFENEMTSVERITQYMDTKPEDQNQAVTETWPESSSIQFKSVTLKYKENIPAALDDISFLVAPKEKIGVVGRTGAGKTSILSALFRLVKFEGAVLIGGVDTKSLPLQMVRSNISIIPQEPVLFSGTVRENLDPFNRFSDAELWAILDDFDLKFFVSGLPKGLDSVILEKGSNLSVGQRQLFCLARAVLRGNKILVLDEATANVDFRTDSLIQSTIKKKLVDCTVLIIAHRLHTIMDCDKVLVMDGGRNVEFDHPHRLLENEKGVLHDLVSKMGPSMGNHLKKIAKESYLQQFDATHL